LKLKTTAVLFLVAIATIASAQGWRQLASGPALNDFESITMINENRGFAVGRYATFLRTDDGGQTWQKVPLDMWHQDPLYKVAFRDENVGFVLGNVGWGGADIWRTTDGGNTWSRVLASSTGMEGSWREISFPAPNVVLIGCNGGFARSTNNGTTFQLRSGWPTCPVIYSMAFRDANVGVVGGNMAGTGQSGIYKTTDGGATWSVKHDVPANELIWLGGNTVIGIAGEHVIRSDNAGDTWYNYGFIQGGLLRFQRITDTIYAGTDELGGVHMSYNGGITWSRVRDRIFDLPKVWPLHFMDPQRGFVLGELGLMHRTSNGGATWTQVSNGIRMQIWDIHAWDENEMIAAGDIGLILNSFDGGETWTMQRQKVTGVIWNRYEDIKSMDIHRPSGLAIAAGAGGVIFRSTDRGVNWQSVGYPALPAFGFRMVEVVDANTAYMVAGARPSTFFFKSTNGGLTWTWQHMDHAEIYDIEFVDANTGFLVAHDSSQFGNPRFGYYKTTNGGATWSFQQVLTPHSSLFKMEMANANVGFLMGIGFLAKTVNGGATWQTLPLGTGRYWSTLHTHSPTEVYAAESGYMNPEPKVWKSIDGGETWSYDRSGKPSDYLDAVMTTPSGRLHVGGFEGGIFTNSAPLASLSPTSFAVESGGWVNGNLQSLASSDDYHLILDTTMTTPIIVRFDAVAPSTNASSITFTYEGNAATAAQQALEMYDYAAGAWERVDSRPATLTDSTVTVTPLNPARFIEPGTKKMRARAVLTLSSRSIRYWQVRIDKVAWTIVP
jgi:photosystem II stability/assembly factor-like uncharacterized protein